MSSETTNAPAAQAAKHKAPPPKIHRGDLVAKAGTIYNFEEITCSLDARGADTKTAFPQLTTVGVHLNARGADTKTAFPQLTTVGGSLYVSGAATKTAFPQLTTVGGSLDANGATTKTAFPQLTTVVGHLDANGAATKKAFPRLTTVGNSLDARGADTKTAFPQLTTVGGSLYVSGADTKTAFPQLTTVGGHLDANGAATKTAFPQLTTVGGSLYANGAATKTAFPQLTRTAAGDFARNLCRAALATSLALQGLTLENGILARIVSSRRGGIKRVQIVGRATISYVVEREGRTAHGATLPEARADLLLKLGNRDTTPFKAWTLETEVSLEEMIVAYRTITGACGEGVSHFLSGKNYKGKLSAGFVIKETEGRYGHEIFKGFFVKSEALK